MPQIIDKELKELNVRRQNLRRLESTRQITEEEFKERVLPLDEQACKITLEYLKLDKQRRSDKIKSLIKDESVTKLIKKPSEDVKMAEENVEAKIKKPSNAQLILKALQLKTVKDFDAVAAKVLEQVPTANIKRIKAQAKVMTKEILAGKGKKASKYKWDADEFLLTPTAE